MAEDNADERRDRHQRAVAAAGGALLGGVVAGPLGAAAGAGLGPLLEPLVAGVWEELSVSARQRQVEVLASAIDAGIREDELGERINSSGRTQLLTGFALSAATRTAWEDKVRTLGRSLAEGLLAEDGAKIDTEQMIIAAITDIEGPQLAMLEFLVRWEPRRYAGGPPVEGPLDIPEYSYDRSYDTVGRSTSGSGATNRSPTPVPTWPPSRQVCSERSSGTAWSSRTTTLATRSNGIPRSSRRSSVSSTGNKRVTVYSAPEGFRSWSTPDAGYRSPRGHRLNWASRYSSVSVTPGRTWTTCGLQARQSSRSNGSPAGVAKRPASRSQRGAPGRSRVSCARPTAPWPGRNRSPA